MLPLLGYIIFLQPKMLSPILKLQALLKIMSTYNNKVFVMLLQVVITIKYLEDITWTRVKGNDVTIGCAIIVSVSTSYDRHLSLTFSSYTMTHLPHILYIYIA